MDGGTIQNCMNAAGGGGVCLSSGGTFTMKNGTITGCKAGEGRIGSSGHSGGGVFVGDGTFTMEGGTITDCEADNHGGGVYAVGTFNMTGGTITDCTARAGGGVSATPENGIATFTMSDNAGITNCKAVGGCGGGAYIGKCNFTMSDKAKITNCTATEVGENVKDGDCIMIESADSVTLGIADSVTISGQITQGFGGIRIDGLGSAKYPYQIGDKNELVLFGSIVNGTSKGSIGYTVPAQHGACAVLTADINLENTNWTPIGSNQDDAYTGTFDGGGHTIKNLNISIGTQDIVSLSGGTFAQIWHLGSFLDLLADGYAFYDKDNKVVNAAKINSNLFNASVRTHQHSFTGGACGCGYTCLHASVDANGACAVCKKQFAASVTVGEDVTYYDTFDNALVYATKNNGCTLKLLADVTETSVMINNPFVFDLNGHDHQCRH